jgi:small subunit ribosomal protein S18
MNKHGSGSGSGYSRGRRAPSSPMNVATIKDINYKDVELLKQFITERGKILPRRITGVSAKQQKLITKAIKRARCIALMPFVSTET